MNPNAIVLTPELYEKLKAEIKRELQNERTIISHSSSWERLKRGIEGNYNVRGAYHITNGVSAILRNVLNIQAIKFLDEEIGDDVVKLTLEYIESLKSLKGASA